MQKFINKEKPFVVCVCGGGNSSHVSAGYLGHKGSDHFVVNVLTRQPQKWIDGMKDKGGMTVIVRKNSEDEETEIVGPVNKVSDNAADVAPDADLFILGGPAHANPHLLKQIAPHVKKGAIIGSIYAQGGFDWAVIDALGGYDRVKELDVTIFGLQNIPWICKAVEYGSKARMIGPKKFLLVASYPVERAPQVAKIVEELYDIPTRTMPNFMCLTLTPSNQIIHPGVYYGIFNDWDGKKTYNKEDIPLLYEGLSDFSANELQELSDELQRVKAALVERYPELDLSPIKDLGERIVEQYDKDVTDRSSLKSIFNSNKGYFGVLTPVVDVEPGKVMPNTNTRFFYEDIPFGLCILRNIGELVGIETPVFDRHIRWFQQWMGKEYLLADGKLNEELIPETGTPVRYGITSADQLVASSLPSK